MTSSVIFDNNRNEPYFVVNEPKYWNKAGQGKRVAVLLGWNRCKDKDLKEYSKFYEDIGFMTIRYTLPAYKIALPRRFIAGPLFDELDQLFGIKTTIADDAGMTSADPPILIFHLFGQHGCSVFVTLMHMLQGGPDKNKLMHRINALVFDSSPTLISPLKYAQSIISTRQNAHQFGAFILPSIQCILLTLFYTSFYAMSLFASIFSPSIHDRALVYSHLVELNLPNNQLYLYSKSNDAMCNSGAIEAFCAIQSRNSHRIIDSVVFDKSPHERHHRLQYQISVQQFVQTIIEREKEKLTKKKTPIGVNL